MKVEVSLSLYHDGRYFAALFERRDDNGYRAAKITFAVQPSDQEIFHLILDRYQTMSFSSPCAIKEKSFAPEKIKNPKRRQREAAKAARKVYPSTKAQESLKEQHGKNKVSAKKTKAEDKRLHAEMQYRLRVQKKKQKHKGR